ncbi:MAG: DUF805 domain-containing protein [Deltaproteobacteria bacterium]|jgi:uncharacterized membrane protein YhaH (DUF805 family)|nr:DUF805 domain-containing protein [Deltaproteobacteria bacterium]
MNYIIHALKNPFTYNGRASRAEFWCFALFELAVEVVLGILTFIATSISFTVVIVLIAVMALVGIAGIVVLMALAVRRAHDFGSGGWIAVPMLLFPPVFLICGIKGGYYRTNNYGPRPQALDF